MGFDVSIKSQKWIHWPDDITEPFTSNSEDFSYTLAPTKYNKEFDGCYLTVLPKYKRSLHNKIIFHCVYEVMYEIKFNGEKLVPNLFADIILKNTHPISVAAFDEKKKEKWFYGIMSFPSITPELVSLVHELSAEAFLSVGYG